MSEKSAVLLGLAIVVLLLLFIWWWFGLKTMLLILGIAVVALGIYAAVSRPGR
jgi:hypothetical protein